MTIFKKAKQEHNVAINSYLRKTSLTDEKKFEIIIP